MEKEHLYRKILSCLFVTAVLSLGVYLWNNVFASKVVPAVVKKQEVSEQVKPKYKHTRIADIKVGERVVVSADDTPKETAVNSATWKKVTLYAEDTWYDGTVDSINVVTLVPPEWIALHDAKVGSVVPIPLDLQEMGLDEKLQAKIQSVEECPEIRAGPGRVVLTTVNHLSRGVCNLTYATQDGKSETIRPTASHRFYSIDRNEWIHISDAVQGEKLQGLGDSPITVVSVVPLATTERVYNMTVEDEHVYHVGYLNLLTHNMGCLKYNGIYGWISPQKLTYGIDKDPLNIHALKHTPGGWYDPAFDTCFKLNKDEELFNLLDEAWSMRGIPQHESSGDISFIIPMGRVIGTKGEKKVKIVINSASLVDGPYRVTTAFPVK